MHVRWKMPCCAVQTQAMTPYCQDSAGLCSQIKADRPMILSFKAAVCWLGNQYSQYLPLPAFNTHIECFMLTENSRLLSFAQLTCRLLLSGRTCQ